ncbi:MAG: hypothetical protein ABEK16_04380 [Candidatus Nanohalobium sp.]
MKELNELLAGLAAPSGPELIVGTLAGSGAVYLGQKAQNAAKEAENDWRELSELKKDLEASRAQDFQNKDILHKLENFSDTFYFRKVRDLYEEESLDTGYDSEDFLRVNLNYDQLEKTETKKRNITEDQNIDEYLEA